MSYSSYNTCHNCKKQKVCTDHVKVQAAINDIHTGTLNDVAGHCGAGSIIIMCHNHDKK